MNLDCYLWRRL